MKKKTWFILAVFTIALILAQPRYALAGDNDLKYAFKYLYKWTASKMEVNLDPKKPVPSLGFASYEEIQKLGEQKFNIKLEYTTDNGKIKITQRLYGFYFPPEKIIYVANDINPNECAPIECMIIHEIVHAIQHIYQDFEFNSAEREDEAKKIAKIFCREHFNFK